MTQMTQPIAAAANPLMFDQPLPEEAKHLRSVVDELAQTRRRLESGNHPELKTLRGEADADQAEFRRLDQELRDQFGDAAWLSTLRFLLKNEGHFAIDELVLRVPGADAYAVERAMQADLKRRVALESEQRIRERKAELEEELREQLDEAQRELQDLQRADLIYLLEQAAPAGLAPEEKYKLKQLDQAMPALRARYWLDTGEVLALFESIQQQREELADSEAIIRGVVASVAVLALVIWLTSWLGS